MGMKVLLLGKKDDPKFLQKRELFKKVWADLDIEVLHKASSDMDLCVALGGDGSLLAAIRNLRDFRYTTPVLGLHMSAGLGFLHSLTYPQEDAKAADFIKDVGSLIQNKDYYLHKRWGISALCKPQEDQEAPLEFWATNDIVISKGHISRVLALDVYVDGNLILSNLKGDGLIVSTATGSTGYSMSAGGPVLDPSLNALVITPVCPHRLSQRPFVINSDAKIEIVLKPGRTSAFLTADGQSGIEFAMGDRVSLKTANKSVQWVIPNNLGSKYPHLNVKNYFESLRTKLGFGGD